MVAANITPDRETGIGNWTEDEFVAAMHDRRGRERLYAAMPDPAYTKMTNDDVLAIRAYLATVAPVRNDVISNQVPFPLNIRFSMVFWSWLNFTPGRYQLDPQKSAEWNRGERGQAIAEPATRRRRFLAATRPIALYSPLMGPTSQGWFAPNITTDAHKGIGGWTKADMVEYLQTGANSWTLASGPMAEAVSHSTSKMAGEDADIAAIASYLKDSGTAMSSSKSSSKPVAVAADGKEMRAGAAIYNNSCAACHKDSGAGESRLFPRLAGSATVQSDDPTTLIRIVLQGARSVSTPSMPTAPAMRAFDWRLDNSEMAAVLTYIRIGQR